MKKVKVLHIEERFHPQMGYQPNFLAKYHSPDIDFHILTTDDLSLWGKSIEIIEQEDKIFEQKYNVKIHRTNALFKRKGKRNIVIAKIDKFIRQIDPDFIFFHGVESFSAFWFFLKIKKYTNCRIFSDTHMLYNQFPRTWTSRMYFFLFRKLIVPIINKHRIVVFATVAENREILTKTYKINNLLVEDLPIGTDLEQYKYSEIERVTTRQRFSIADDEIVLIYTGKLDYSKKPHLIIEAIRQIETKIDKKLVLFFVGSQNKDYFDKYFGNLTFDNNYIRIVVEPFVDSSELYKYYSMADFAVLPTENSLSCLDMQACRLPVVMIDDITNAERLQKGGLLFKEGDINDLADKIMDLINNDAKRKILSEQGFEYVKQKYDYQQIVSNFEKKFIFNEKH